MAEKIMGLDFGSKTVGVAISDDLMLTAQGKEIVRREHENKLRRTLARIEELIVEYGVTKIVMGLPLHMNGDEGDRVAKTKQFGEMLERRSGIPIEYLDERLTTVEADEIMIDSGIRREDRKKYVDMVAAEIILQDYLDSRKM
ncbi:MAG: Holliday junction resolvase RuvX [Lachnospiraceae bacterium]|nr:Holliday junction resolvase RuvX [Candidatus Merdinaster equi]